MERRYVAWVMIWLIPIIPIVVLYVLFAEYNVLEFQDAPGGLKAIGPIGAYLVLVSLALRNRRLFEARLGDDERRLLGSWRLTSRSRRGHVADGECRITDDGDTLCMAGTFVQSSALTSTWRSTVARLHGMELFVVYELTDVERAISSQGFMKLILDEKQHPARLSGDWAVIGREGTMGTVEFTRSKVEANATATKAMGTHAVR